MAAAELTEAVSGLLLGSSPKIARAIQVTQYDWVNFDAKGIHLQTARLKTGAGASVLFSTLTVNNSGTAYSATSMSIAYDGATIPRSEDSFYLETASGELIEVIDSDPDGAAGTLTVLKRGALGTPVSATGLADGNTLYVRNVLVLGDSQTGAVEFTFYDMEFIASNKIFG